MKWQKRSTSIFALLTFAVSATALSVHGQEDQGVRKLQTVIVTSQKIEETLQDVPVSVVATTGTAIENKSIQELAGLANLIPNFAINEDPIGDKINIRGLQSGNNAGLEQSVATFVDGVYRGRGVQSRYAFLDVGRVEVLRGPQGTLFGKNTIGGAVNIISAKPTDALESQISSTYTFDGVDELEFDGYISGPLSETVRGRIAGKYRDLIDGHLDNIFYDESTPQMEEYAVRGILEWDASAKTLITLRGEYGDWDQFGQPFGIQTAGPLAAFGVESGRTDITNIGSINPVLDIGSSGNFFGDNAEISLTAEHDFNNGTLTAIAAYSAYDFVRELDADFNFVDVVRFDDTEDFEQTTFELRYASERGRTIEYIVGGFYLNNSLFADGRADFNVRATGNEIAIDTLLNAGCLGAIAAGADPATTRACILDGLVTAFDGTPLAFANFSRLHFLDQDDELFAVFGQTTWNMSDALRLTVGARFATEEKTAVQSAFPTNFGTRTRNDAFADAATYGSFGAPDPFTALAEGTPHTTDLARSEDSFTWSANLAYDASDDLMLYAKASTGFKAGGYNSFALGADPDEAEYEEEEVLGFEIGAKSTLLNGAAELNAAAFFTEFDDLQTALFTGSTSFIVQNAAAAEAKGIELDGRWAATDNLTIAASLAYLDFTFTDFPNAGCTVDQLLLFRTDTANPLATLQNCGTAGINDLTGRTSEHSPKWSGSLSLDHVLKLPGGYELNSLFDVSYQSKQFRQADLDPLIVQEAFAKINLALVFGVPDGYWDLSLIAKNLTDKSTISYGNDAPLIDTARQNIIDRPRTIGVRLRLRN